MLVLNLKGLIMLLALCNGKEIDALSAQKGTDFLCPECLKIVILKKGQIKIPHFAHKPPINCAWGTKETQEHLEAKRIIRDSYRQRGYDADYETVVLSSGGDRRADVLISYGQQKVAIEIQHQSISYDDIERRTRAYIAVHIPVMWLGILSHKMQENAEKTSDGLIIEKYTVRPWEKWAHALYFKELWYIDPESKTIWQGSFSDYMRKVESTSWYENGIEQSAGGYSKKSKRWKMLYLRGPYSLNDVNIGIKSRKIWERGMFNLPAGKIATFQL